MGRWRKLRHYPGMKASPLDPADDARHLLGHYLRARREAMPVSAAAYPAATARRRTPGLRREEVAQAAAISTSWYTWLEQGRDMSLSVSALSRLADVLHLSAAERTYVFELARRRDQEPLANADDSATPPALFAAVQAMLMPAYLLDRRWRLCGANSAAANLFAPWVTSAESCLLRYVFLDPSARDFIVDWDERAARLVAEFRADTALYPNDAALALLIAELRQESPTFADFWQRYGLLAREGGRRTFDHPQRGRLSYEQVTLTPSCSADYKLVLLLSTEDSIFLQPRQPAPHAQ